MGSPSEPIKSGQQKPSRRAAGARREASLRVVVTAGGEAVEGWTLNLSSGGLRAVLTEHVVKEGDEVDVLLSDRIGRTRRCRVVWSQEQLDGQIVGMEFIDIHPPAGT